jgi:hypothetical protein
MINETSAHQDHVIAHVIGATVLGYFIWDESLYLLLDIGFIWRIYLDYEMGLLPASVAIDELEANPELKQQLKADADLLLTGSTGGKNRMKLPPVACLIKDVNLLGQDERRNLIIVGEEKSLSVQTSTLTREITVNEWTSN